MTLMDPSPVEMAGHVLWSLEEYAMNGMEVCRDVNGHDPWSHKGCHFKTTEKGWGEPKGGCQYRARGCKICQKTVLNRLNVLEKKGLLHSIKIRWFDSRNTGAAPADSFTFDLFRIFYVGREGLARRLIHDVWQHVDDPVC